MGPKAFTRGKDKGVGEGKSDKPKADWTIANKKFVDLALEEKHNGIRLGKAYDAVGWEILSRLSTRKRVYNMNSSSS